MLAEAKKDLPQDAGFDGSLTNKECSANCCKMPLPRSADKNGIVSVMERVLP